MWLYFAQCVSDMLLILLFNCNLSFSPLEAICFLVACFIYPSTVISVTLSSRGLLLLGYWEIF